MKSIFFIHKARFGRVQYCPSVVCLLDESMWSGKGTIGAREVFAWGTVQGRAQARPVVEGNAADAHKKRGSAQEMDI